MYKNFLSFLLLCAFNSVFAQFSIPTKGAPLAIEADNFNNIYVLEESGNINKYDSKGQAKGSFSIPNFSGSALLDVSNPLQIVIYNPESRVALILDQSMNTLSEFPLENTGIITSSVEGNGFLIVDFAHNTVKHINNRGTVLRSSPELSFNGKADKITAYGKNIYILSGQKLYLGDVDMQYFEEKAIDGIENPQLVKGLVIGKHEGYLYSLDVVTNEMRNLHQAQESEWNDSVNLKLAGNYVFVCRENELQAYLRENK